MADGKKSAVNFTAKEESLLMSLVKQFSKVLECKQSDTNSNKEKIECWRIIEKKVNSSNGKCYRSDAVLKKKYDNMKKRAKKNLLMKEYGQLELEVVLQ